MLEGRDNVFFRTLVRLSPKHGFIMSFLEEEISFPSRESPLDPHPDGYKKVSSRAAGSHI
jgi:hypothetical protein